MACNFSNLPLSGTGGVGTEDPNAGDPSATPEETSVPAPPDPSGHIVFTSAREGDRTLYLMNADGTNQYLLAEGLSVVENPVWSKDGTRVAVTATIDDNTDIYIVDVVTGAMTRVTDAAARDSSPTWSPDGSRLAFESFRDGNFEIYIVNSNGSGLLRLTSNPVGDTNPAWSPDGTKIAFTSGSGSSNSDIFIISPDGSGLTQLTSGSPPESDPVWSPDGNKIAYRTFPTSGVVNICVMNKDGSGSECLTDSQWENGIPSWSPDGMWLAFRTARYSPASIQLVNVADRSFNTFSGLAPVKGDPVWSPDGYRLIYQADAGGNMELYEIIVSTSDVTQVTYNPGYDGEPAWTEQ